MIPAGFDVCGYRMYFKGTHLQTEVLNGHKRTTTRKAVTSTMKTWRTKMRSRTLIRGQGNWGLETIFAWILITAVSNPAPPAELITPAVLDACGHQDMSPTTYIREYLSTKDEAESTKEDPVFIPVTSACVVQFSVWSLGGTFIPAAV